MSAEILPEVVDAYEGVCLIDSGEPETGFNLLRKSAEKGVLYAWECLTWHYLLSEEFAKSISFFEQNFYAIKDWGRTNEDSVERRLDNIKNNVAIAYFALEKKDKSLKLWDESLSSLSVESRFYFIIASQSDEKLILNKIYEEFGVNELEKLSFIFKNIASTKSVWFKQFTQKLLPLLNQSIEERNQNILRLSENLDDGRYSVSKRFGISLRSTKVNVALPEEDLIWFQSYIIWFVDVIHHQAEIKEAIAAETGEAIS